MIHGLLGRKLGMSQLFDENGIVIPVTIIKAGPCYITQLKTIEKDGYNAIQIGFERKMKNVKKPMQGHFKKAAVPFQRFTKEIRIPEDNNFDPAEHKLGEIITVSTFRDGDIIDVSGTSKGKGFQGTVKRHNFAIGPRSHGSMNVRRPGSIGQSAYPARVFKGMKMSGHMGNENHTTKNLVIVKIDKENNLLFIKGSVPGHANSLVYVKDAKTGSKIEQRQRPLEKAGTEIS